jgi:carboxymethylenebutenolidase
MTDFDVPTADGVCPVRLCTPASSAGPWPGVILIIDGGGVRAAIVEMAQSLANEGYAVAVPDLMYRTGSPLEILPEGAPRDLKGLFSLFTSKPEMRAGWMEKYIGPANKPAHVKSDFAAILPAVTARPEVKAGRLGIIGYCMGGTMGLRVAGLFPEHFAAIASFHGGHLATPAPDSPHLGLPQIKAEIFVAGAEEDPSFSEEIRQRLTAALANSGQVHRVETWAGSRHGFAVNDSPAYKPEFGARRDGVVKELFGRTLRA